MARTQIYLGDEDVALLARVEQETGASRSELIRRAIRRSYGGTTPQDRITALRQTAGSWAGRSQSRADYVDTLRTDLNERLGRLGL